MDESFEWMNGFEHQMSFHDANENAIHDESSPSAISTASQSGISEVMLDVQQYSCFLGLNVAAIYDGPQ